MFFVLEVFLVVHMGAERRSSYLASCPVVPGISVPRTDFVIVLGALSLFSSTSRGCPAGYAASASSTRYAQYPEFEDRFGWSGAHALRISRTRFLRVPCGNVGTFDLSNRIR